MNFGGTVTIENGTFNNNNATYGGAIDNFGGSLTILDSSSFSSNTAQEGGGIRNLATLSVTDTYFGSNTASQTGGGIDTRSSSASITDSLFSDNSAQNGGGIYLENTLSVTETTFQLNTAQNGAAIDNAGSLTVSDSTFNMNVATNYGGCIRNLGSNLEVSGSTLVSNDSYRGGGIWNGGPATLRNSTFYNNDADQYGGGIFNTDTLTVSGCTIAHNEGTNEGGGIYNFTVGTLNLKNSILADSVFGADCYNEGTLATNLGNLVEDNTCSPAVSGNPLLLPLADNGGPTQTMALGAGSPAINTGNNAQCEDVDQRGVSRPQGALCDIGAFELPKAVIADFNGDGDTDFSYYRPSNGYWYHSDDGSTLLDLVWRRGNRYHRAGRLQRGRGYRLCLLPALEWLLVCE